jgi:hypothetical protein
VAMRSSSFGLTFDMSISPHNSLASRRVCILYLYNMYFLPSNL